MLQPSRRKYRKDRKGRNKIVASRGVKISFGDFGLKSLDFGSITSRQIESARRVINHYIKRQGKTWIRIFPDKPVSKKPAEVRMGNGKGNVEYWIAKIQPGKILYELSGINEKIARRAFYLASNKLPIRTTFISRKIIF